MGNVRTYSWHMAQLTIYVPDRLARKLKRAAAKSRMSVSAYLTELATRALEPQEWPPAFVETFGSWEGPLPRIEDSPPGEPPDL